MAGQIFPASKSNTELSHYPILSSVLRLCCLRKREPVAEKGGEWKLPSATAVARALWRHGFLQRDTRTMRESTGSLITILRAFIARWCATTGKDGAFVRNSAPRRVIAESLWHERRKHGRKEVVERLRTADRLAMKGGMVEIECPQCSRITQVESPNLNGWSEGQRQAIARGERPKFLCFACWREQNGDSDPATRL